MKIACYTDIHNQQVMLNYPTVLRRSAVVAADNTLEEFGKVDLAIVGGDNVSDYPYWNRSCALPYRNWLDLKQKLTANFARTAQRERVLYVNGNNDLILGDLPTAENPPYNTCEFYHAGPMKQTLGELAQDEYYGVYAKSKGKQAGMYHLAFHYVIDGIDFFGLNIDPDSAFDTHDGVFNRHALLWLKSKLAQIDPQGNRLIFVVGHLSTYCRKYGKIELCCAAEEAEALLSTFAGHRNLFYLFGHEHGQSCVYTDSASGVIPVGKDLRPVTQALRPQPEILEKTAFHLVHMGGLRPFLTEKKFEFFEPDGLTGTLPGVPEERYYEATGTPKLAQYLLMEVCADAVTLQYRNTGTLAGYTQNDKPKAYTVKLRK